MIFVFNTTGINDVQAILDNPTQNYGWVLRSLSETVRKTARRWSSHEGPDLLPLQTPLPGPALQIT